jgi:hypothetical protein
MLLECLFGDEMLAGGLLVSSLGVLECYKACEFGLQRIKKDEALSLVTLGLVCDETLSSMALGLISWGDDIIARFLKNHLMFDSLRLDGCECYNRYDIIG